MHIIRATVGSAHFKDVWWQMSLNRRKWFIFCCRHYARFSSLTEFTLCKEMSIWRDSLTVGRRLEYEMLLSNRNADRPRDKASDRTVGECRTCIHAVVSVWLRKVRVDLNQKEKCWSLSHGLMAFGIRLCKKTHTQRKKRVLIWIMIVCSQSRKNTLWNNFAVLY